MVRQIRFALAVLVLLSFAGAVQSLEIIAEVVKKVKPAVVTVVAYKANGDVLRQGSGFFIDGEHIITNWHVIEGADRVEIKGVDGNSHAISGIAAVDEKTDLASVQVKATGGSVRPLEVTTIIPEAGETVIVVGSPMGLDLTVSNGIVSAVRTIDGFGKVIQISAPVSPGSSGSPVVNLKGQVIGVAVLQSSRGQNLNFAIPGSYVIALRPGTGRPSGSGAGPSTLPSEPTDYMRAGLVQFKSGDYRTALTSFTAAVKDNPRNHNAWFLVAACQYKLKNYEAAVTGFQGAILAKPDFLEAYVSLGNVLALLDRFDESIKTYKAALKIDPDYPEAHFGLGLTYLASGRSSEAMQEYRELQRLDPELAAKLLELILKVNSK